MEDGVPRYVTSVSRSDANEGWREHRADGQERQGRRAHDQDQIVARVPERRSGRGGGT